MPNGVLTLNALCYTHNIKCRHYLKFSDALMYITVTKRHFINYYLTNNIELARYWLSRISFLLIFTNPLNKLYEKQD